MLRESRNLSEKSFQTSVCRKTAERCTWEKGGRVEKGLNRDCFVAGVLQQSSGAEGKKYKQVEPRAGRLLSRSSH